MKLNHGGKRTGSGRKPCESPKQTLSTRIRPELIVRLRDYAKNIDKSQAEIIEEAIELLLNKKKISKLKKRALK